MNVFHNNYPKNVKVYHKRLNIFSEIQENPGFSEFHAVNQFLISKYFLGRKMELWTILWIDKSAIYQV
ncbi:hypothetical protein O3M35_002523 [Rhynocoris fuscipes]|uniref:Uncharacterized protein n=1 Tax=Rhynocoris fuscipes TaxID=488301 RepID=A0AAW1CT92_9HEMI